MMERNAMRAPAAWVRRALNSLCVLTMLAPALTYAAPAPDQQSMLIAHGNYIVHKVGMCIDCHTPKDAHGQPLASQDLRGAELPMEPKMPVPGWASRSVNLVGLPAGYTEVQLVTFLETGITPRGTPANPPMPSYRLNERDARSVAAYLHSIN